MRHWSALALAAAVVVPSAGCTVDERRLSPITVTYSFGASGAGGADDGGSDFAAGGDAEVWSFDTDTDGFTAESGIQQSFSHEDAAGYGRSGSLDIVATLQRNSDDFWLGGTSQCVPVVEDRTYDLELQIYIPHDQGAGSGGFVLEVFNAPDCEGLLLDLTNLLTADTGSWQRATQTRKTPLGSKSASMRLVVDKPYRATKFEVLFDNVHFVGD